MKYLVIGTHEWNSYYYHNYIKHYPGEWYYSTYPSPGYDRVFVLHYSKKIPEDLIQTGTWINFHMTDLPYGKGGSPLQNLILAGNKTTKITAHIMTKDIDAGPIVMKSDAVDISIGSAERIYHRINRIIAVSMIPELLGPLTEQQPYGNSITFKRRTPEQSQIPNLHTLSEFYDFVRMLDAPGYPKAFITIGDLRLEIRDVHHSDRSVFGQIEVTQM